MDDCIFCKIARGEAPAHIIWENDNYMAFLTIFPNTQGFSVVIPKKHYSSYFAEAPENVRHELLDAAAEVSRLIDSKLPDVGRTGLIFEGFGVDHLHAKLFPMHGTKSDSWKQHNSHVEKYFDQYEGYISSHNGPRAADEELLKIADQIRK